MPRDEAHRAFKDRLYGQFARVGKALGSAHRLELLELTQGGLIERAITEITAPTDVRFFGRGPFLHAFDGPDWYRLDIRSAVPADRSTEP